MSGAHIRGWPPLRQQPKGLAREMAKVALELREGVKLKFMSSNSAIVSPGGGDTPDPDAGAFKSAIVPAPANEYTDIQLFAVDATDDPMDFCVLMYGQRIGGIPFMLLNVGSDNVPGGVYWTWYNDLITGLLTVRLWNGLETLEVRACVI